MKVCPQIAIKDNEGIYSTESADFTHSSSKEVGKMVKQWAKEFSVQIIHMGMNKTDYSDGSFCMEIFKELFSKVRL